MANIKICACMHGKYWLSVNVNAPRVQRKTQLENEIVCVSWKIMVQVLMSDLWGVLDVFFPMLPSFFN